MRYWLLGFVIMVIGLQSGCDSTNIQNGSQHQVSLSQAKSLNNGFVPKDEKVLLIIGQDLGSVREYTESACCPTPAGVTTYLGLYKILDKSYQYGGIGIDPNGKALDYYADWGGGISSLYSLMQEYPNSAIAIGLSMTENEHPGALQRLIDGDYDKEILHLTRLVKTHPHPIYMRVGYEFDGMWNAGYGDRQKFIKAYQRVVDVMRQENAKNITFVWQSSSSPADDSIEGYHENIADWYPGDDYVDWMGLSWFLVPNYVGDQANFASTQNALADEVLEMARERNKPVMVAESSPLAYDLKQGFKANHSPIWDGVPKQDSQPKKGEDIWNEWYATFFDYIYKNDDVIRAVAYINANWDAQNMWSGNYQAGYWGDSRVQENEVVLNNWLDETGKGMWISTPDGLNEYLSR